MDGLILLNKPSGWTSFDVVAKVRGVLRSGGVNKPKVGHSGTLDPLATGLLILLIGSYTKKADSLTKLDKIYSGTITLGETSSTGDAEGEIVKKSTQQPSLEEIKKTSEQFIGQIEQIPPAYSAIKINGERAYKLIRKGINPDLKARRVQIYSIGIDSYDYPEIQFTTRVSSGTYIRSLVADIGEALGTGAYMSSLERTSIGDFKLADAIGPENLTTELIHQHLIVV